MFGSKLKTWMENYIGRTKKKEIQKEKHKGNEKGGIILESSESLAQSDTGISSSSQQVFSSSTTDNREGYSTTTMESERSGMTQTHTTTSLPSPESAYSTGYSTDGASPGATGPPEYYINIRTGKHYFPSPAPTPTTPQPKNDTLLLHLGNSRLPDEPSLPFSQIHVSRIDRELSSSSSPSSRTKFRVRTTSRSSNSFTSQFDYFSQEVQNFASGQNTLSTTGPDQNEISGYSKSLNKKSSTKSQLTSLKFFLKSPKNERGRHQSDINKILIPTESKKNLILNGKSKKWFKQPFQKFGHKRTDSSDEKGLECDTKREANLEKKFCYILARENSASPRQRNRIKTNPWLPTEPLSSQTLQNLNFSPMLMRNRSCSNTPLQNRKTRQPDSFPNRILQLNSKFEESRDYLESLEKVVNRHLDGNPVVELSDPSEEDVTLNEMMGTYNESYVYEKETDILSDSDPTDCEDYGTDSEANNGGDERDSHDDELDFIDNGSVIESEDSFPRNTGNCTYYDAHIKKNSYILKSDRLYTKKGSEYRKGRREKRRHTRKSFKRENEEMKMKTTERKMEPKTVVDENVGGLNLSRVLGRRLMSKSAEGTPVIGRRQETTKEFREYQTHLGNLKGEETLVNLYLGDAESDVKYEELIAEAENMFENMRKNPTNKIKKELKVLNDEGKTLQRADSNTVPKYIFKNTVPKQPKTPTKKNPRDLGLALSIETPKKLKRLDFETKNQSSFKTKSSAHSPLDPLGPTLRNFTIFKPASEDGKLLMSSSEESENSKIQGVKERERRWGAIPTSPVVPFTFQSVDLGKPITSYCPQSEPVKRKIYTCSKTYDKLVKKFENKSTIFEENINGGVGRIPLEVNSLDIKMCLNGNQGRSPHAGERSGERLFNEEAIPSPPHGRGESSVTGNFSHSQIPQVPRSFHSKIFERNFFILEKKRE